MDWIRRNWPDLLIGLALLAVIAGIIATLLNGGSFLSTGPSTPPSASRPAPSTASPGSSVTPSTPTTGVDADATSGVTPVTPGGTTTTPETGLTTGTTTPPTSSATSSATSNATSSAAPTTEGITPVAPGTSPTPSTSTSTPTSTSTSTSTTSSSASSSSPAPTTAPVDASAPFRIGVGSFSQPENAERRAAAFREAGYPVFTVQQGPYTVVLVGPYESRSEAEAVEARIRSSGMEEDPILYQVTAEGSDDAQASSSSSTSSTPTSTPTSTSASTSASASTSSTTPAGTASSSSGLYIQVGAYNSPELAAPQRERLEALGYSTTLQQTEGSTLLRLWIGPFPEERLAAVRAQLDELGIENFIPAQ